MNTAPSHLKPRKRPRQARAAATVDAIFEATIQILVLDGPARLTTTRVAERAGVSVGTMYQYFPHKQALFYAVNERYLDVLAGKVEVAWSGPSGCSTTVCLSLNLRRHQTVRNSHGRHLVLEGSGYYGGSFRI
ncbi:MAG: TetR/AcrR family transcriptional regulator [Mesorhizobium sp.]|nr:TetR/AcrR family transcriptional regulator [Mesorhizobium sp.]